MWALLSLMSFVVVYLAALSLGIRGLLPFIYAAITMFSILLIEGLLRGEMWLFDPQFGQSLTNTDMPFRLVIFVGGFLLILETIILLGVAVDPRFERALGQFLINKSCVEQPISCTNSR